MLISIFFDPDQTVLSPAALQLIAVIRTGLKTGEIAFSDLDIMDNFSFFHPAC